MKHVIVYGPQGCGKTRNKEQLARKFGCETLVDGVSDQEVLRTLKRHPGQKGTLFLMVEPPRRLDPEVAEVIPFHIAMEGLVPPAGGAA